MVQLMHSRITFSDACLDRTTGLIPSPASVTLTEYLRTCSDFGYMQEGLRNPPKELESQVLRADVRAVKGSHLQCTTLLFWSYKTQELCHIFLNASY